MTIPRQPMTRHGTFLIVCISLMTLMVILSFSLLHSLRFEVETSTANQRYLLAQAAARSGLDHALLKIAGDYAQTTMNVLSDHPTNPDGTTTVRAATHLDGQYRAPFVSQAIPNYTWGDMNAPTADNDVRAEDSVLRPWAWWGGDFGSWWNQGMLYYDGRGRYYEPGFTNITQTSPQLPIPATGFIDPHPAPPERSAGAFYDEQFHRIPPSGDPVADRLAARYRLRYAVGVEDLGGHFLINPVADPQLPVDYRTPGQNHPWMPEATNALASMIGGPNGGYYAGHLEHVFQGRGWSTNCDLNPGGFPMTYPLMYRQHPNATALPNLDYGDCDWGVFFNAPKDNSLTSNLFWSPYVNGDANGGEVIWNDNCSWYFGEGYYGLPGCWPYANVTYSHCLMGNQLSFDNTSFATCGDTDEGFQFGGTGFTFPQLGMTPFGHRQVAVPGYNPAGRAWYQGRCDTPFNVNLMTVPPSLVSDMVVGYLPAQAKVFKYTTIQFYQYTGLDGNGNKTWNQNPLGGTLPIDGTLGSNNPAEYGRDLLVSSSHPAFITWPPPVRSGAAVNPPAMPNQVISPDYFTPDTRTGFQRYPGIMMNGDPTIPGQGGDDLGEHLDTASELGGGVCTYTRLPFVSLSIGSNFEWFSNFGNDLNAAAAWATIQPPANWGASPWDFVVKYPDPQQHRSVYSYWFDICSAMAGAISVFRGQYVQYDQQWRTAASLFPSGDRDPASFQTIRDLDRVFLAELGESQSLPGTGSPQQLHDGGALKAWSIDWSNATPNLFASDYIPENNIFSLVANGLIATQGGLTSAQRAQVMELMLNDMRMSFFGSSPEYSDGLDPATGAPNPALEFRPLDFIGDGQVRCSCYPNGVAPVESDGRGPKPDPSMYFSLTGNFSIGHSHYYRVWSRGEVWDNRLQVKVNEATLDTAIAFDPNGNHPSETQVLYQRWFFNKYLAMLSHIQR